MKAKRIAWTGIAVMLATIGALLQTPAAQPPPQNSGLAILLPAGATLVLQAKNLASLVGEWNSSTEKSTWLESDNYQSFSRSRLFLRLKDAFDEFSTAAGVPPDMSLVSEVAGTASALGLYDIGKLEFLYVTALPAARAMENALWRTRGSYEPRQAAGTPFYVRVDPESKRVVAFAVRDGFLVLATREDLVAGALALIGRQTTTSVAGEVWFAQATGMALVPGDVRLVANLQALTRQPHFRSYWIQGNAAELRGYVSAVSDLHRSAEEISEHRVLLRAERAEPSGSPELGQIMRLIPGNAGLYRAWTAPTAQQASTLIIEKVIATSGAAAQRDRSAPRLGSVGDRTGSAGDLETRIDEEPRAPRVATYQFEALTRLVAGGPLTSMLQVESTRTASDGVFVDRGAVIVLARAENWAPGAARDAIRAAVDPIWTKAHIGMRWLDATIGGQTLSHIEGLERVAIAERGNLLLVANDPALLAAVLARMSETPLLTQGTYAAGFNHALERGPFTAMMRLVENPRGGDENREPMFFSENVGSLGDVLARVERVSVSIRDRGTAVDETVQYRLVR